MDAQEGGCPICGRDGRELFVDHSYRTGRTHGLLCRQCNCGLGMLGDSPKKIEGCPTISTEAPSPGISVVLGAYTLWWATAPRPRSDSPPPSTF
jgi:hypothetical protein